MKLAISTNADQVLRDIDAFAASVRRAAVRAANDLTATAKTAALREISSIYGIGPRSFEKYVTLIPATGDDATATLRVKGRGFPLALFDPHQTKRGVSVRIKRRRILIPHAFIARMANGHLGVFAKGAYGGKGVRRRTGSFGRFVFGYSKRRASDRSRLPINELYTFAPPDVFANRQVLDVMVDRIEERVGTVMRRAIAFEARR